MLYIKFCRILVGVTLGIILALLIAPQTRWIVVYQVRTMLHLAPAPGMENPVENRSRIQAIAAQHPNDFELQLAAITWENDALPFMPDEYGPTATAQELRRLETRFPDNPSLRANILRLLCGSIRMNETADDNYLDGYTKVASSPGMSENDPKLLAEFLDEAKAGQKMDPQNAYFTSILACGYYADNNIAAAEKTLLAAGRQVGWNSYSAEQVHGEWRLVPLLDGDTSAIMRQDTAASQLFPQYSDFRVEARMTLYDALLAAKSGQVQKGIALRQALIHVAGLMSTHDGDAIAALVGEAIWMTAVSDVNGVPSQQPRNTAYDRTLQGRDKIIAKGGATYAAYLHAHHDKAAAQEALAEANQYEAFQSVLNAGSLNAMFLATYAAICWWVCDLLLLSSILCLLVAGTVTAIFSAYPLRVLEMRHIGGPLKAVAVLLAAGLAWSLVWWTVDSAQQLEHLFGQFVEMAGVVKGTGPGRVFEEAFAKLTHMYFDFSLHAYLCQIVLTVPLAVLITALFRTRKYPFCRAFTGASLAAVCILSLAYSGLVVYTAHHEKVTDLILSAEQQSQGQYMARAAGKAWP